MTKTELIENTANKLGCSKKIAGDVIDSVLQDIVEATKKNDSVVFMGFGTFSRIDRGAKTINSFGKKQDVEASSTIKFKPSKTLKNVFA